MRPWIALIMLSLPAAAFAAADTKLGADLHAKRCTACHIRLYGHDGSEIYTRSNHIIKTLTALRQRVAMCATQTNAQWFPEDEENVTAFLNQRYYKFGDKP